MIKPIKVLNNGNNFHWGTIGMFVSVLSISSLGLMTNHQWQTLQQKEKFLNTSVISRTSADYGASEPANPIVQVNLSIIGDMIRDSQPETSDLTTRLASVKELLLFPLANKTIILDPPDSDRGITIPEIENPIQTQPALLPMQSDIPSTAIDPITNPIVPTLENPVDKKPDKLDKPKGDKGDKGDKG